MTLILKFDLDIVKMYHHTKNEVSMSTHSKVIARTDTPTDTHTQTHTDMTKTLPLPHTREVKRKRNDMAAWRQCSCSVKRRCAKFVHRWIDDDQANSARHVEIVLPKWDSCAFICLPVFICQIRFSVARQRKILNWKISDQNRKHHNFPMCKHISNFVPLIRAFWKLTLLTNQVIITKIYLWSFLYGRNISVHG